MGNVPTGINLAVVVAVASLAVSAIIGAFVIMPATDYAEGEAAHLREVISSKTYMAGDEQTGLHRTAELALGIMEAARKANRRKAGRLQWQLRLLALGAAALALATVWVAASPLTGG